MLKEYINLVSICKNQDYLLFQKTDKNRSLIHKYEWDNDINDNSILAQIELLSSEISGYAHSLANTDFTRCNQTLDSLRVKSIYDNKIIINWLTEENILIYNNYYIYVLFLENYRIAVIKACEEYLKE